VAIVKSAGRADVFVAAARSVGCTPVLISPFRDERVEGFERPLAAALREDVTWVAITSPNAVTRLGEFAQQLAALDVAAVGPGTATALHTLDVLPALVGTGGGTELARLVLERTPPGSEAGGGPARRVRVVHPCAEESRPEFSRMLREAGADVRSVPVYRMVRDRVGERSAEGAFDAVVIGSPRLAQRASELFPARPPAVAIGRTTAAAMRDLGWRPRMVAATASPADVARALEHVLGRAGG
jgi:uroporphyrinogen-III synthase